MADVQSTRQEYTREICVIGAGVSGLRAAGLLAAAGFNVTVLEARNRIGGRVQQTYQLGLPLDVGASWLHGTLHNPIVALAEKESDTTVACGAVESICDTNGDWLNRDSARHQYEEVWKFLEMAMEKSRQECRELSDSAKLMDFFRQMVQRSGLEIEQSGAYEALML